MSKELFIAAHEQLVAEAMERDPNLTWDKAYDQTADRAYDRMRENLADKIDGIKQRMKDEGNWPPKAGAA